MVTHVRIGVDIILHVDPFLCCSVILKHIHSHIHVRTLIHSTTYACTQTGRFEWSLPFPCITYQKALLCLSPSSPTQDRDGKLCIGRLYRYVYVRRRVRKHVCYSVRSLNTVVMFHTNARDLHRFPVCVHTCRASQSQSAPSSQSLCSAPTSSPTSLTCAL